MMLCKTNQMRLQHAENLYSKSVSIKDEENDRFILNIRQHVPKHGDQIFRSQILDIGLYYEGMVPKFVENVII